MPILSAVSVMSKNLDAPAPEKLGQRLRSRAEHHQEQLAADEADGERCDHPARGEGRLVVQRNEDDEADDDAAERARDDACAAMTTGCRAGSIYWLRHIGRDQPGGIARKANR